MGMPTAAESSQLDRMKYIAGKLREGTATQAEKDEAQAIMLEVYVAERAFGLISVSECEMHRSRGVSSVQKMISDGVERAGWNTQKAAAVIISVISVCGTVAGIAVKLLG